MEFDWRALPNNENNINNVRNQYEQTIRDLQQRINYLQTELNRVNNDNSRGIAYLNNEIDNIIQFRNMPWEADHIAVIEQLNAPNLDGIPDLLGEELQDIGNDPINDVVEPDIIVGQEICAEILTTIEDNKEEMQNQTYMNIMEKLMEIYNRY